MFVDNPFEVSDAWSPKRKFLDVLGMSDFCSMGEGALDLFFCLCQITTGKRSQKVGAANLEPAEDMSVVLLHGILREVVLHLCGCRSQGTVVKQSLEIQHWRVVFFQHIVILHLQKT